MIGTLAFRPVLGVREGLGGEGSYVGVVAGVVDEIPSEWSSRESTAL